MLEYTVQYMQDQDWVRVTAVYDKYEDVRGHAADLVMAGFVVRVLVRNPKITATWYTIYVDSNNVIQMNHATSCPK